MPRQSIFNMSLSKIYPMLVQKAERKNRTQAEVNQIICWLTGYSQTELAAQLAKDIPYQTFFEEAPQNMVEISFENFHEILTTGKTQNSVATTEN